MPSASLKPNKCHGVSSFYNSTSSFVHILQDVQDGQGFVEVTSCSCAHESDALFFAESKEREKSHNRRR